MGVVLFSGRKGGVVEPPRNLKPLFEQKVYSQKSADSEIFSSYG